MWQTPTLHALLSSPHIPNSSRPAPRSSYANIPLNLIGRVKIECRVDGPRRTLSRAICFTSQILPSVSSPAGGILACNSCCIAGAIHIESRSTASLLLQQTIPHDSRPINHPDPEHLTNLSLHTTSSPATARLRLPTIPSPNLRIPSPKIPQPIRIPPKAHRSSPFPPPPPAPP